MMGVCWAFWRESFSTRSVRQHSPRLEYPGPWVCFRRSTGEARPNPIPHPAEASQSTTNGGWALRFGRPAFLFATPSTQWISSTGVQHCCLIRSKSSKSIVSDIIRSLAADVASALLRTCCNSYDTCNTALKRFEVRNRTRCCTSIYHVKFASSQ